MKKILYDSFRLLRPRQWIKNLALFAAITFSGQLFDLDTFEKVLYGFFIFCLLSSAIYIVNDIFDIESDRIHPFKRFRPLANRDISVNFALAIAIILGVISFFLGAFVTPAFFVLLVAYGILQLSYSLVFKKIAVIDILAIAAGYILRVYAGTFIANLHISVWLLLTTISISLFLAIGKRRSELTLIRGYKDTKAEQTRASLSHYSERLLDVYASIFATSTFISYGLFTFLEYSTGVKLSFGVFLPEFLPEIFQRKWLMITIIPVVYGVMRYLQDIYEKQEGESPEKVLLSDKPLLINVLVWFLLVIAVVYFS